MEPVLLASAVHDLEPRVVLSEIDRIVFHKGERPLFRISYRMADHASAREEAVLELEATLDGVVRKRQAAMHDRLGRDDESWGSLVFDFDPPRLGKHVLQFRIRLRSQVTKAAGLGRAVLDGVDREGSIIVEVR